LHVCHGLLHGLEHLGLHHQDMLQDRFGGGGGLVAVTPLVSL
jgi:hypothetical protein